MKLLGSILPWVKEGSWKNGSDTVARPILLVSCLLTFVTVSIDYSDFQVPFSAPSFYLDPDYPMNSYVS